jgi:hypothetical protein
VSVKSGEVHLYSGYHTGASLEEGYVEKFGNSVPEEINQEHQLVLVCSSLDSSSERIIQYLSSDYGVPINAVFFRFFRDGANEFLARSWLIEPSEAEARSTQAITQKKSDPWNGRDFVVNIGQGPHRTWEDCSKYGFVSGGGGRWYSGSLRQLFPGARVFANIPGEGFVGVGIVKAEALPIKDFIVKDKNSEPKRLLDMALAAPSMNENADDPDLCEYVVAVEWQDARRAKKLIARMACKEIKTRRGSSATISRWTNFADISG